MTVETTPAPASGFDRWFELTKRGSTIGREIRGGLVTFFTMAYIIVLNPIIIGTTADKDGNLINGLPLYEGFTPGMSPEEVAALPQIGANIGISMGAVAAATALIAGVLSILMGAYARFPIALATGLGLNSMLAYTIAPTMTWPQANGLIVWEGVIILILVLTGFRKAVFNAVPKALKAAISVGIGLFIAFIGLVDGGIVRQAAGTPTELGIGGSLMGWPIAIFLIGFALIVILYARKVKGAILIAILAATVIAIIVQAVAGIGTVAGGDATGWELNVPAFPDLSTWGVDLSLLGRVDLIGAFAAGPMAWLGVLLLIFSLLLADFFDTMGTMVAVAAEGGMLDEAGNPPHTQEILIVDSIGAIAGGLGSVSSNTSYVESASGVGDGARTGIASIITGLAFLLSVVLAPFVNMVPSEAAAPALLFVGFLMMGQVVQIKWDDVEEAIPAFLAISLMPFAYSITVGIGAGFITYVLVKAVRGKAKQIHPLLWVVMVAFVVYFARGLFG
ncbi:MAG: NCS2 family permease [Propionibacteriaceae bacterium]|jgi:AGZA family xanthine/uracil permease-like MFS transporter|nr:NCS2 family permease [Propionibacteriaceae bacterium]